MLNPGLNTTDVNGVASEETLQALPQSFNDESLWLLRRLVKIMESSSSVDSQNRQRIAVDNIVSILPASYYAGVNQFNIPNSTVFAPGYNGGSVTYVQPVQAGPVDPRWQIMDQARLNHQQCVRNNLVFTS